MKALYVSLMLGLLVMVGCAPSATQLKKVVEDNPDIVFSAIEKNPEKFLQVVNAAAQKARAGEEEKYRKEEMDKREDEFKNPKAPEISDNRIRGNKAATVTVVEYSDFQCPFCKRGHKTVQQVMKDYGDKVRVIFKNFPIERIHPQALPASKYYEAMHMQDHEKAFKFHDMVFDNQEELSEKGEAFLKDVAKKVGAKMAKLQKDINSEEVKKVLDADRTEAEKFGFSGTPGYLINGVSLKGAYPYEEFKVVIDRHLKK